MQNPSDARRGAARKSREAPLNCTHQTEDGPIRLLVKRTKKGEWMPSFSGPTLEGSRRFKTLQEAHQYLLACFDLMFPRHHCTKKCKTG